MELFQLYTEANLKNKLLVQSQKKSQVEQILSGMTPAGANEIDLENLDLNNIKNDIIMIQFKLVRKDTMKTFNTQTFINVPSSKQGDINLATLNEIVAKQSAQKAVKAKSRKDTFLPFNKSILTRILFPSLNKQNILVISHFSKKTIQKYLKIDAGTGYQPGPAKGLFNALFKLGFGDSVRLMKKKLTQQ